MAGIPIRCVIGRTADLDAKLKQNGQISPGAASIRATYRRKTRSHVLEMEISRQTLFSTRPLRRGSQNARPVPPIASAQALSAERIEWLVAPARATTSNATNLNHDSGKTQPPGSRGTGMVLFALAKQLAVSTRCDRHCTPMVSQRSGA